MARRPVYESDYDSDDSTLVNSRTSRRRRDAPAGDSYARPRPSRRYSSPPRRSQSYRSEKDGESSTFGKIGKIALGVALAEVVVTCFSMWMKKKDEEREKERRRERKRQFEKAKAKRRRDEERREREQDERERRRHTTYDYWDEESELPVPRSRRIGYVEQVERSRSESRPPRQIEAPPDFYDEDEEEWESRRRRAKNDRSRSRPAVDVS